MLLLHNRRQVTILIYILAPLFLWQLSGCTDEPDSVKLGFIGGISGRVADFGANGRNGVLLAIEEANRNNGIHGKKIELLIKDDKQNPQLAQQHLQTLESQSVAAILGPMTSSIAVAILPQANQSKILIMGVTTTSEILTDIDDYFFRAISSSSHHVGKNANLVYDRGYKTFSIAIDTSNSAYTESWLNEFSSVFKSLGGNLDNIVRFASSDDTNFVAVADKLMSNNPDGVALVSNPVDAALIATHVRKLNKRVLLLGSEWTADERLIELGGAAVEGMITAQYFDRQSKQPKYLAFRSKYIERFGKDPSYASVIAYNAANIIIRSLQEKQSDESLKQTILRIQNFEGLQSPIVINSNGDSYTDSYLSEIRDGAFQVVSE